MRKRRINKKGKAVLMAAAFLVGIGAGIALSGHGNASPEGYQTTEFVAMKTVPMDAELQRDVYDIANEYGVDWTLLMAIIQKESRFNPYAVSATNDYGLMQINAVNHGWLSVETGVHDFLDPRENVRAGAYMLSQLLSKYQDPQMALMAYNMGEGGASWYWEQGIYTSAYSREVVAIQRELKRANKEMAV